MNKLRSDSAFCQLTPEQVDVLEGWLFEERLGYPTVVEKLKAEFGLETSLTGVRRFYKRLEVERSRQSLMDVVETSGFVRKELKREKLKPAMLLLANKCVFEMLMQSPVPIKEVTTLLRTITSAEARAMRQTVYEKEEADRKEAERIRKARESWQMTPWDLEQEKEELRQERAARKKAKQEAAEKAAQQRSEADRKVSSDQLDAKMNLPTPHPDPVASQARHESVSPEETSASRYVVPVEGRGSSGVPAEKAVKESVSPLAKPDMKLEKCHLSPALSPGGGEGEEQKETSNAEHPTSNIEGNGHLSPSGGEGEESATEEAGGTWKPSVVEEREDAENCVAEAAENRLTPLNAA